MNSELTTRHGALADAKEKMVTDIGNVLADADNLLKEVIRSTGSEFTGARENIDDRIRHVKQRLHDARIVAATDARHAAYATREYVGEHPWKIFGIAAAALVIAALVSRRE